MCLRPKKIRNPTQYISINGGQPLYIEVPCGNCAECKKNKRLEWHFRAYHQCLDTINKGGYVYFDTLTYSDEFIPKISHYVDIDNTNIDDFTCFCVSHWRNFLKNLRRQLAYHHTGVSFKYFLTSEYGTDDRYTHRPHYHILFFIYGEMDAFEFSRLVSKCWPYGRTDGMPWQSHSYVSEHIYGYHSAMHPANINKVCNYVSKYVTKDSTFQRVINKRIDDIKSVVKDDDELKKLIRDIDMFHRCSQGFGIGYLESLDPKEYRYIFENGCCRKQDNNKVVLAIKLPLYYKRKMFYKCLKDEENKIYWQLTPKGVEYQSQRLLKVVDDVARVYADTLLNANDADRAMVLRLLRGRDLTDFAIYKLFYKGRCRHLDSVYKKEDNYCKPFLSDTEYNLYDWLNNIIASTFSRSADDYTILYRDVDRGIISIGLNYDDLFCNNKHSITYDYNSFIQNAVFNENSCSAFRNFDKLDALFKSIVEPDNYKKQLTFDFIEELIKKFQVNYE